jgi:hypothetical protein
VQKSFTIFFPKLIVRNVASKVALYLQLNFYLQKKSLKIANLLQQGKKLKQDFNWTGCSRQLDYKKEKL